MDKIALRANERELLGKQVKKLRKAGILPGHVFGNKIKTEHVSVKSKDFFSVMAQAGETGLIDLKIGSEKMRPVLIRDVQYDPVSSQPLHIDFYQVNLSEKVTVPVPLVLIGEQPESVHAGEAVVLQVLNEVQVEALPTDLVENIEVDISKLVAVDDAILVRDLIYNRVKLSVLVGEDEVIVKLAPAVTAEMQQLLAEQEAESQAASAEAVEEAVEGEAGEGAQEEVPEGAEVTQEVKDQSKAEENEASDQKE